jgi:hypothetical protein
MSKQLLYRASDEEVIFLEENNLSWTDVCREALNMKRNIVKNDMKEKKRKTLRAVSIDLMIFFIGVLFLGLTYLTMPWVIWLGFNVAALIAMSSGFILLSREILASRRG